MTKENESEVISLVKDLQKRLMYLEKKLDILIGQSSDRPSGAKSYSSSPRSFGGDKNFKDNRENRSGSKGPSYGRSFGKKREEGRGASAKRKPYEPGKKSRTDRA